MLTKEILRKNYLDKKRQFLDTNNKEHLDALISEKLAQFVPNDPKLKWGSYKSLPREADPFLVTLKTQIEWAYPRIQGDSLQYYIPTKDQWMKNEHNIEEPNPRSSEFVELNSLAGVLMPGIAFDRRGFRLGWGKAFYDKTLKNFKGKKIGVAYSVQLMDELLPKDNHDIPVDIIVTEKDVIIVNERT